MEAPRPRPRSRKLATTSRKLLAKATCGGKLDTPKELKNIPGLAPMVSFTSDLLPKNLSRTMPQTLSPGLFLLSILHDRSTNPGTGAS